MREAPHIFIQARMSSLRQPGKVLVDISGLSTINWVVQRCLKSKLAAGVVILTSDSPADSAIEHEAKAIGIPCFRGSLDDVLGRFVAASDHIQCSGIVRITADCPLVDPEIIDEVIRIYMQNPDFDYVSNVEPPTYPDGLDVEVFSKIVLDQAAQSEIDLASREHVTVYMRKKIEASRRYNVSHTSDLSKVRFTLDTAEDLKHIREIVVQVGTLALSAPWQSFMAAYNFLNSSKTNLNYTLESLNQSESQRAYRRAKTIIPGGTQLLSKRPEMQLPELWPPYYQKAKGCNLWDLDGRCFLDCSLSGIGSVTLGYADEVVDAAVLSAVKNGSMSSLNCIEDLQLADILLDVHKWSDKVRFARSGGEAMAVAVRVARAATSKHKLLVCGYHGWHDWYLAANLSNTEALTGHLLPGLDPGGVPTVLAGSTLTFKYNSSEEFSRLFAEHKDSLAAVIMEPQRNSAPEPGFLEEIRAQTKNANVPLIMDEITAGWRLTHGGAHLIYGIEPDLAVFAKGMSNGFPMAAILGTAAIMDSLQSSFVSSTYWTERVGPVAAIATISELGRQDAAKRMTEFGQKLKLLWADVCSTYDVPVKIGGLDAIPSLTFDHAQALELKTLFTQKMLEKGILASGSFYINLEHTKINLKHYYDSFEMVMNDLGKSIKADNISGQIFGPLAHTGFSRLT
jgi:glutamate-1-semialdehyde 2,1-aminomutase